MKIFDKLSAVFQTNIGSSYTLLHQDGKHKNSLWRFYLPLDTSFEYDLKNGLNLTTGVSIIPPIYLSTTVNYFIGIKKEL